MQKKLDVLNCPGACNRTNTAVSVGVNALFQVVYSIISVFFGKKMLDTRFTVPFLIPGLRLADAMSKESCNSGATRRFPTQQLHRWWHYLLFFIIYLQSSEWRKPTEDAEWHWCLFQRSPYPTPQLRWLFISAHSISFWLYMKPLGLPHWPFAFCMRNSDIFSNTWNCATGHQHRRIILRPLTLGCAGSIFKNWGHF